jgi:AraC-like DNA-binding protein
MTSHTVTPDMVTADLAQRPQTDSRHSYGLRSWRCHPNLMELPHRHSDIEINFLLDGEVVYLHRDRVVPIQANQLALFWAAIPHQLVERPTQCDFCILTSPFEQFLAWNLPDRLTHPLLLGELLTNTEPEQAQFDRLLLPRWHTDLAEGRSHIALKEIEARLLRFGSRSTTRGARVPAPLDKAGRMASFIIAHHTESISVGTVADAAGLHPSHAMASFKQAFNLTILEYLLQYRITQAQRLLATTDATVLDVGLQCGFGSASNFHAAFKRHTGYSPRAYRQSLLTSVGEPENAVSRRK